MHAHTHWQEHGHIHQWCWMMLMMINCIFIALWHWRRIQAEKSIKNVVVFFFFVILTKEHHLCLQPDVTDAGKRNLNKREWALPLINFRTNTSISVYGTHRHGIYTPFQCLICHSTRCVSLCLSFMFMPHAYVLPTTKIIRLSGDKRKFVFNLRVCVFVIFLIFNIHCYLST